MHKRAHALVREDRSYSRPHTVTHINHKHTGLHLEMATHKCKQAGYPRAFSFLGWIEYSCYYMWTLLHTHTHTQTHTHKHTLAYTHTHAHTSTRKRTHKHAHTNTRTRTRARVHWRGQSLIRLYIKDAYCHCAIDLWRITKSTVIVVCVFQFFFFKMC
jgi:hypothetical protein